MAGRLARGEIWLLRLSNPDKRRPVLILSRPSLLQVLNAVTVASITTSLRGVPTEVPLGINEGLKRPSCVNLCNLHTASRRDLRHFVGALSFSKMQEVCLALQIATGCE